MNPQPPTLNPNPPTFEKTQELYEYGPPQRTDKSSRRRGWFFWTPKTSFERTQELFEHGPPEPTDKSSSSSSRPSSSSSKRKGWFFWSSEPKPPAPPNQVKKKNGDDGAGWWLHHSNAGLMYFISHFIREYSPNYLASLPIPYTIRGWLHLRNVFRLVPPTLVCIGIGWLIYLWWTRRDVEDDDRNKGKINLKIEKHKPKVVNTFELDRDDVETDIAYCRCWLTMNWPYCDGSHQRHNEATGDNVGPFLIVRRKRKGSK